MRTDILNNLFVFAFACTLLAWVALKFTPVLLLKIREITILMDHSLAYLTLQLFENTRIYGFALTDETRGRFLLL